VRRWGFQVEIIPDALPEALEVTDRPLAQLFVIAKIQTASLLEPAAIARHLLGFGFMHEISGASATKSQPVFAKRKIQAVKQTAGTNACACDLIAQALMAEASRT
jgi:hypothetical protein